MPSFIKGVIYNLKRNYGQKVIVYRKESDLVDPETGKVKRNLIRIVVNRAIVLKSRDDTKFTHDITPHVIGRMFNYGGYFDISDRLLILDRKDLPKGFELKGDDYFIIKNRRYNIRAVQQYEDDTAYILEIRQMVNENLEQIVTLNIRDVLIMRQDSFNPISRNLGFDDILLLDQDQITQSSLSLLVGDTLSFADGVS